MKQELNWLRSEAICWGGQTATYLNEMFVFVFLRELDWSYQVIIGRLIMFIHNFFLS